MKIEDIIEANTAALIENTAVLREILAASGTAPAAATAVKKSRTKPHAGGTVEATSMTEPEPVVEETPEQEPVVEETHETEAEDALDPDLNAGAIVPDLPIPELRKVMKEKIKERIFAEPHFEAQFKEARKKYGVEVLKDLADDQVTAFYAEVLA